MTVRIARVIASLVLTLGLGGCTNLYEISIETPIQPKMDVSSFQRVLIAGFLTGGTEDVDTNLETVRLLRSQLRTRSRLQVIDADVLSLVEIALEQAQAVNDERPDAAPVQQELPLPEAITSEEETGTVRAYLREREFLADARRGVPRAAHRHRDGLVHAPCPLGVS